MAKKRSADDLGKYLGGFAGKARKGLKERPKRIDEAEKKAAKGPKKRDR